MTSHVLDNGEIIGTETLYTTSLDPNLLYLAKLKKLIYQWSLISGLKETQVESFSFFHAVKISSVPMLDILTCNSSVVEVETSGGDVLRM